VALVYTDISKRLRASLDWQSRTTSLVFSEHWEAKMRFIWLLLAFVLIFAWVGGFVVYHAAGFAIHILLILAFISIIIHLFSARKPA
jgi:hypothetical protein